MARRGRQATKNQEPPPVQSQATQPTNALSATSNTIDSQQKTQVSAQKSKAEEKQVQEKRNGDKGKPALRSSQNSSGGKPKPLPIKPTQKTDLPAKSQTLPVEPSKTVKSHPSAKENSSSSPGPSTYRKPRPKIRGAPAGAPATPAPVPTSVPKFVVELPQSSISTSTSASATPHAKSAEKLDAEAVSSRLAHHGLNGPSMNLLPSASDGDYASSTDTFVSYETAPCLDSGTSSSAHDRAAESGSSCPPRASSSITPEYREYCRDFMAQKCRRRFSCPRFHPNLSYEFPVRGIKFPRQAKLCPFQENGRCISWYGCEFVHGDFEYDDPSTYPKGVLPANLDVPAVQRLIEEHQLRRVTAVQAPQSSSLKEEKNIRGSKVSASDSATVVTPLTQVDPSPQVKPPEFAPEREQLQSLSVPTVESGPRTFPPPLLSKLFEAASQSIPISDVDQVRHQPRTGQPLPGRSSLPLESASETIRPLPREVPPTLQLQTNNSKLPSVSLEEGVTQPSQTSFDRLDRPRSPSSIHPPPNLMGLSARNDLRTNSDAGSDRSSKNSRRSQASSSTISYKSGPSVVQVAHEKRVVRPPPPPRAPFICRAWLVNQCSFGTHCQAVHPTVDYDPPVKPRYPTPKFSTRCQNPQCTWGRACEYTHPDLDYNDTPPYTVVKAKLPPSEPRASRDVLIIKEAERYYKDPPQGQRPRPTHNNVCLLSARGACWRRYKCQYLHEDLVYDPPEEHLPENDPPPGQRPYPTSSGTCHEWLAGRCRLRYRCTYRHSDLEYDTPLRPPGLPIPPSKTNDGSSVQSHGSASRSLMLKVKNHARVKLGPGFDVEEVITGFETPWVYLGKIPSNVSSEDLMNFLRRFGEVVDIKMPYHLENATTMLVRVRFSSSAEALEACSSLNGSEAFGNIIAADRPIHSSDTSKSTIFQDTSVRIRWEAPSKVAYCGYSTMEAAYKAIDAAQTPFMDHYLWANIHSGLPVAGIVTVRFRGVPLAAKSEDMERFNYPDDVVWGQPNYRHLNPAINGIRRLLTADGAELVDFTILPPPYKNAATITGYAHFATASGAKVACNRIAGRKPSFTGNTMIYADHLQSLTFSLPPALYTTLGADISALNRAAKRCKHTTMTVIRNPPPQLSYVRLSGDDLKELGQLKAEFENILNWETLKHGSRVAWDPFFACPAGVAFLDGVRRYNPGISIECDPFRSTIRLRGWYGGRSTVRERILAKVKELQSQKTWVVKIEAVVVGQFLGKAMTALGNELGRHNLTLDLYSRQLRIRGDEAMFTKAREFVQRFTAGYTGIRRDITACPVCFDEVTNPVVLPCGHKWCSACLSSYLTASVSNKSFPLTCLGSEGKCKERLPLHISRKVLNSAEFDALVEATLTAYVQARPEEYHYCPTPDCTQIYRSARTDDVVLQCPSCLLRICSRCHVEAHDGLECVDPDGGNDLFKDWVHSNDVKPCPGCKIPIERSEGCNHLTCTQCKTHICWVCMQTFPGGVGIYDHMRAAHGGIGLDP